MYTQPQIKYMAANKQAVQDAVNRMDVLIDKLTALVQSVHAVNNEDAQAPERVLMRMYTRELRSVFDSIDEFVPVGSDERASFAMKDLPRILERVAAMFNVPLPLNQLINENNQ